MSIYLTELGNWLRWAGLNVIEYEGWESRARSSGGYSNYPFCVMWHHTASPASWDGQRDADYCAVGHEDSPVCNLYIDRSGTVWVLAAGASNTNGKGKAITFSRGTVPMDGMNTRAVGVEMGNDGLGETWPRVQIDAMFAVSNAVNSHCGNQPDDVSSHWFYAPDRKIDPATAAAVQGPWKPRSCTSSGTWELDDIRAECLARANTPIPIPPPDEEVDMLRNVLVPTFDGHPDWPWLAMFDSGTVRPLVSNEPEPEAGKIELADVGQYQRLCAWAGIDLP